MEAFYLVAMPGLLLGMALIGLTVWREMSGQKLYPARVRARRPRQHDGR